MDRCRAPQRFHVGHQAAWCALPCDPSQPVTARTEWAAASNPPLLATYAGNLRLSFQAAPETPPHRTMAWDRGALSARFGDASTRPQWLADKLRAPRR